MHTLILVSQRNSFYAPFCHRNSYLTTKDVKSDSNSRCSRCGAVRFLPEFQVRNSASNDRRVFVNTTHRHHHDFTSCYLCLNFNIMASQHTKRVVSNSTDDVPSSPPVAPSSSRVAPSSPKDASSIADEAEAPCKDRSSSGRIEALFPMSGDRSYHELVSKRDSLREGLQASTHPDAARAGLILGEDKPTEASVTELIRASVDVTWLVPKMQGNLRSLGRSLDKVDAEREEATQRTEQLLLEGEDLREKNHIASRQLDSARTQVQDLSEQLETAEQRSSSLSEELESTRQQLQVLQSDNAQGGQELEGVQRVVEQLQAENRQLREANADLSERCLSKDVADKVAEKLLKGERYRELAYMERDIKLELIELFRQMDVNCWPAIHAGLEKTEERQRQREARRAEAARSRRPSPMRED